MNFALLHIVYRLKSAQEMISRNKIDENEKWTFVLTKNLNADQGLKNIKMIWRNVTKFVFRSPLVNVGTQKNGLTEDQLKQLPLLEQTWLIMTYMKFALMRRTKSLPLQHSCTMASFTKSKMASATWLTTYSKWSNKHITFFILRKIALLSHMEWSRIHSV